MFPDSSKVLRSKTMSYQLGMPLVFKIDEVGDPSNGDGIGLTTASFDFSNMRQVLQCPGSVSVNSKGVVYVNGSQMTMRLPSFHRGTVVTFGSERLSEHKLRVSITVNDKQVTFDWPVTDKGDHFYFAMGYQHSGWQITVWPFLTTRILASRTSGNVRKCWLLSQFHQWYIMHCIRWNIRVVIITQSSIDNFTRYCKLNSLDEVPWPKILYLAAAFINPKI